jgi:selenocysteine lyase/cysteine desulfurase
MPERLSFQAARPLFPHAGRVAYFNSASYGPLSTPVADTVRENLELRLAADRDDTGLTFDTLEQLRSIYARLIGAAKREVGIGLNTSHGLNVAAFGLPLKRGDEVLLSDVEFPALTYTWRAAAERRGLKLRFVKSRQRRFDMDLLERALTGRSRVLAVSWVQFFDGYKLDLAELSEFCRHHDLYFVVDGIQGMGVEPLNLKRLAVDIFSSGCQKWMLSPQGCGFFYVSDRVREQVQTPFFSWLGVDWKQDFTDLFKHDLKAFATARRFELGYYAVFNLLGMRAAAGFFTGLGIGRIRKHNYGLIDRMVAYLGSSPVYRVSSSLDRKHRSSIVSFTCPDFRDLHRELLKAGIITAQREGSIRVSVHLFNDDSDMDRLLTVLDDFAGRA